MDEPSADSEATKKTKEEGSPLEGASGSVYKHGFDAVIDDTESQHVKHCLCPWCELLLREPVQAQCGHRFCRRCCLDLIAGRGAKRAPGGCPLDDEPISEDTVFNDLFAAKETFAICVMCSSKRYSTSDHDWCQWRGILRDYEEHEAACRYIRVTCTECLEKVKREDLLPHKDKLCRLRLAQCLHCGREMVWKDIKGHQEKECLEVVVPCPNGCSSSPLARKDLETHSKTCPLQTVNCYYNNSGCEFKGRRQELRAHHDNSLQYHLQLVDRTAQEARVRASEIPRLSTTNAKVQKLETSNRDLLKVTEQQSSVIKTLQNHFSALDTQLQEMREAQSLCQETCRDLAGRVKTTEEQLIRGNVAASAAATGQGPSNVARKVEDNIAHLARLDRTTALHDLQMSDLSMRQDILDVRSQTGNMVWKISDLQRRVREARSGKTPSLYSPPFYTSACGYKMCLRLYLNGDGAGLGTHLSLFFAIMRGDFDSLLKWPFQQKVTLMLLNQMSTMEAGGGHILETFKPDVASSSFHRPDSDMNVATGCPTFTLLTDIAPGSRFVKEDSIFIKVCIDLNRLVPPDAPLNASHRM